MLLDHPVAWLGNKVELAAEPVFELGGVSIDPVSREATFGGQRERLQPQNLKVLILLARRKGQVVTRDDIVECCWDARFVGDDVINRSISTLRQFAKRAGGFDIETVPRAGYRLIETHAKATRIKRWRPMIAAAAALLIAVTGWYLQRSRGVDKAASAPTIAVLPFAEGSPGRDVHELAAATRTSLSDALTEGGYPVTLIQQRAADRQPDLLVSGEIRHTGSSVQALVQVQETRHGAIVYSHRFEAEEKSASRAARPDWRFGHDQPVMGRHPHDARQAPSVGSGDHGAAAERREHWPAMAAIRCAPKSWRGKSLRKRQIRQSLSIVSHPKRGTFLAICRAIRGRPR